MPDDARLLVADKYQAQVQRKEVHLHCDTFRLLKLIERDNYYKQDGNYELDVVMWILSGIRSNI